ncbi:cytochrome c [Paenibacillus sp. OV219]|uniref:c-type cytochrome n=1 Tax=Paenibacillus sp. OV219 TaxID=1884377 RepID=UPI0008C58F80|nr:cytochrome c [Paenibacillus sp. OV219]SEO12787.1 cytochrome c551 [Paenibacillus sp. OV219]
MMGKSKWLMVAATGLTIALSISACGGNKNDNSNNTGTNNGSNTSTNTPSTNNNAGAGTVDTAAAETVFKSNCVSCHAADLSGGMGPNLQKVGGRLSVDEISTRIHQGGGGMPAFQGQLTDDEITNLAGWLKTKQ